MIKPNMIKKLLVFVIFLVAFLLSVSISFASTLSLSPKSSNIPQGSIMPVQIKLNTAGESVNGIASYLSYPQDKLEVASINYGASSFDIAAESVFGAGTIKISRGSINGINGNAVIVATINFKGKSQAEGATVSFIKGSGAPRTSNSTDSLNLTGSSGGTYAVVGPKSAEDSQLQTDLAIKDVLASLVSTNSATITWTTDKESDSTVEYGLQTDKYFLEASDKELVKEHKIVIQGNLIPGETFHYRVRSKDNSNEAVSDDMTFQLKGYSVRITVLDQKANPVKDAQVILYSSPIRQISDGDGVAIFADVSPARHLVVVKSKEIEISKEIDVKGDGLSEFTITLNFAIESSNTLLAIFYASLAVIICIIIIGTVIMKRKSNSDTYVPPMVQSL